MYYFLPFPNLHNYNRRQLTESIRAMDQQTGYYYITTNWIGMHYNTTTLPQNSDPLSFLPVKPKALSFYEFGYTSDFVNAEFEVLLQILITTFKLAILRLMVMLPFKQLRKLCKQVLKLWEEIILFELIMLAPQLNVITGIFYQSPHLFVLRNFQEMANLGLIHSCSFLCLFLFLTTFIIRLDKLKALFIGRRRRKNE